MQNIKTGKFEQGDGGVPEVTFEDSIMAGANVPRKYYLAAKLVISGDESDSTITELEHHLWSQFVEIIRHKKWDVPEGAEIYRNLTAMAIADHLHPLWFKNDKLRCVFFNRINWLRQPKKPISMTPSKWHKKWKARYTEIYNELGEWANIYLRQAKKKLG